MFFKNKDRQTLIEIKKQLEYQTKLIESIFETIDESKQRANSKKKEMADYFDSVKTALDGMGGNSNSPIMKPLNDMIERLKQ